MWDRKSSAVRRSDFHSLICGPCLTSNPGVSCQYCVLKTTTWWSDCPYLSRVLHSAACAACALWLWNSTCMWKIDVCHGSWSSTRGRGRGRSRPCPFCAAAGARLRGQACYSGHYDLLVFGEVELCLEHSGSWASASCRNRRPASASSSQSRPTLIGRVKRGG